MTRKNINCPLPYLIFFFVFLVSFYSCSSEKPEITRNQEQGSDLSSAKISSDESQKIVQPSSTKNKTTEKGSEVISKNSLPIVEKAQLKLENINNMDVIKVIASGMDKDNDVVTLTYEWLKNEEPAGYGDSISGFRRGDKISVKITPYDGKEYGYTKTLLIEIQNTTPKITQYKEIKFDGSIYTGQVTATDPDGDTLTYSLKTAPSGMTINPATGQISWNVPPEFTGKTTFTVFVTDGYGGEAMQSLSFAITTEKK